MVAVDHRLAFGKPALPNARSKKSFSSVNCPILACSSLKLSLGNAGFSALVKDRRQVLHGLLLPLHDLIGMHVKWRRKLGYGLVATQGSQGDLGLEL